jgi:hypothetical protein
VSNAKEPAAKIPATAVLLKMSKEGKKGFLNNLLAILTGKTEGDRVPKEAVPQFVEKAYYFLFQCRRASRFLTDV